MASWATGLPFPNTQHWAGPRPGDWALLFPSIVCWELPTCYAKLSSPGTREESPVCLGKWASQGILHLVERGRLRGLVDWRQVGEREASRGMTWAVQTGNLDLGYPARANSGRVPPLALSTLCPEPGFTVKRRPRSFPCEVSAPPS